MPPMQYLEALGVSSPLDVDSVFRVERVCRGLLPQPRIANLRHRFSVD
jgi:hypothetical protein